MPWKRSEHVPEAQLQTVFCDAFVHCGLVLGCFFRGSSCSTNPQLLSEHVELLTVAVGIHCCIDVPPMELCTSPIGTFQHTNRHPPKKNNKK